MENVNSQYLGKHKKFRTDSKKLAVAFFVSAFIVSLVVFWWLKLVGITVTGEALCGLEEHTHSSECYTNELICDFNASEESTVSAEASSQETTEAEELTAESHIHTEECVKETLICTKTEHIHSADCFPDKTADTEKESDWLSTFDEIEITDDISENLIAIAMSQVGYEESGSNFEYDAEGNKNGYTRYGEWYGSPYGNWNTMFVSFCLHYSQIYNSDALISMSAVTMQEKWEAGLAYENADKHTVQKGDIAFIDTDSDEKTDTVGIVTEIGEEIKIVVGDSNNRVEVITLSEDKVIGYGLTSELKSSIAEETTDEVTEETTDMAAEDVTEEATQQTVSSSDEEKTTASLSEEAAVQSTDEKENVADGEALLTQKEVEWLNRRQEYYSELDDELKKDIDALSEEDRDLVLDAVFSIYELPELDTFIEKMDSFYTNDDAEGEQEYYLTVQEEMITAYARYQAAEDFKEYIFNLEKLMELKDFYSIQMYTTGTSSPVTFNYVNRGWSAVAPIVITGGSAREVISTGSKPNVYWNAIVVDYDYDYEHYYVSYKYSGGTSSDSSAVLDLKPATSKGFIIFIWMADTSATTAQKNAASVASNVQVNDRVTVSVDPHSLSAGYNSSGYGTVTFSEYVPPATETEEDLEWYKDTADASDSQVDDGGGRVTSADKKVVTTKTINGTSEENIFDITLTVQTQTDIQTFLSEPDMAVVIVMDISNTMNDKYPSGSTTSRYDAAVVAAENFMNQFAQETSGLSQVGFVAFNTHAHEILSLQPCTTSNVSSLISEMKTDTRAIIKATGYANSHDRFTNVEGGLKRGYDMLKNSGNANQYIIFLSDGFPTTYLQNNSDTSTNYDGYDPYTSSGTIGTDGVFHDDVTGYYCSAGTSYSDKASIKARVMANKIKTAGAKIFSIGVDVGGQTINGYERTDLSIIDRTSRTYEIGSATSTAAYTNWLKNSIGSGYYYDSENSAELEAAFENIFDEIRVLNEQTTKTVWTATDPMPVYDEEPSVVGFIHFYDKDGNPVAHPGDPENITGTHTERGENTANHEANVVHWDLKKSGYTTSTDPDNPSITYYTYSLKYRVRLVNEKDTATEPFTEGKSYETNGDAYLEYRNITTNNDVQQVSDIKYVSFSKPAVHGFLAELMFTKTDALGVALPGAEFTLTHDDANCTECHGDHTALTDSEAHQDNYVNEHAIHHIGPYTAISDSEGAVSFTGIPSGHSYTLTETVVPAGYVAPLSSYNVQVDYNVLTVTETLPDGTTKVWTGKNNTVTNIMEVYLIPETGGTGTLIYTLFGIALMAFPILYSFIRRKRERGFT